MLRWTPRRICFSVSAANQRSTRLIQEAPVGVKCRWKRGCRASQRWMGGVLWVAGVVEDQMHVEPAGTRRSIVVEELPELEGAMPPMALADDLPVLDVEGGEERGGAVAHVVVGAPLRWPGRIGSSG